MAILKYLHLRLIDETFNINIEYYYQNITYQSIEYYYQNIEYYYQNIEYYYQNIEYYYQNIEYYYQNITIRTLLLKQYYKSITIGTILLYIHVYRALFFEQSIRTFQNDDAYIYTNLIQNFRQILILGYDS